jgi:glycosyltransferase involved in cell wall biosynthesis
LKIIFCLRNYLPSHVAGTEIYVAALCADLQQLGVQTIILKPGFGKAITEIYFYKGQKVIEYPQAIEVDKDLITGKKTPSGLPLFKEILQQEKPDIIHFHEISGSNGITMAHVTVAKNMGIPIFTTLHVAGYVCKTGKLLYKNKHPCDGEIKTYKCAVCCLHNRGMQYGISAATAAAGMLFKNINLQNSLMPASVAGLLSYPNYIDQHRKQLEQIFDDSEKVFVLSDWFKQVLMNNSLPENKMVLLPKALPHDISLSTVVVSAAIDPQKIRLVFMGRLNKIKGLHLLIEALNEITGNNWMLDIYGQTEDKDYAQQCITMANKKPGKIFFKNVLAPGTVLNILRNYDALVCPTIVKEMVGLVVMEAFAVGLPVIGADSGGIAEQVTNGVDGFLFKTGSSAALAKLLQTILNNPLMLETIKINIRAPHPFNITTGKIYKAYIDVLGGQA